MPSSLRFRAPVSPFATVQPFRQSHILFKDLGKPQCCAAWRIDFVPMVTFNDLDIEILARENLPASATSLNNALTTRL